MSLHRDLLEQARHLASNEPRRPKQASLRRAISAAYYPLFHLLVSEGCLSALGGSSTRQRARSILSRCFDNGAMAQCCKAFDSGALPSKMGGFNVPLPISPDLQFLAQVFVELQDERHRADYDTSAIFHKADTARLVDKAVEATKVWCRIRKSDEAASFLLCLLFWKILRDR